MTDIPSEISNFFLAMQAGEAGLPTMEALFAPDAVYEEPFSGKATTHNGRDAVLAVLRASAGQVLPAMHIHIDRAETASGRISVEWTCYSPALPSGAGRGRNVFEMRDGKIARLTTTLLA